MIEIIALGLRATIQDVGRLWQLRAGVPTAGPADRVAHAAANTLVGNEPGAAAIEVVGLPFAFAVERPMLVAAAGDDVNVTVRARLPGWTCLFVRAGEEVRVEGRSRYAYVALSGAIEAPSALGSRAAYPPAELGPPPLRAGDRLRLGPAQVDPGRAGLEFTDRPDYRSGIARVVLGPHDDRVDARVFLEASYAVDERSDRMGVRLRGPSLHTRAGELLTCGMVEGAVQVPRGGQPIVLLADHQTTGGYPVVATVVAADLPVVAQAPEGAALRFVRTTEADAVAALQRLRRAVGLLARGANC